METKYRIRVLAFAVSDDDGSNAPTMDAGDLKSRLESVNSVLASANIEFVFKEQEDFWPIKSTLLNRDFTVLEEPNVDGDKWDHKPEIDEATHKHARNEFSKQFDGRLVILIHKREELKKDGNLWSVGDNPGGSSGASIFFLEMSDRLSWPSLGHELGHYLQLPHTFDEVAETVTQAATAIKKYVEVEGHEKKDGLDVFDGDRAVVLDTPADTGTEMWTRLAGGKCGPVGQIPITVKFTDGTEKIYTLKPDRGNLMSYFKSCENEKNFSAQQNRRMRDALELRWRHNLISIKPSATHKIQRRGLGLAGAIQDVEIAQVRSGRVVTAVRLSDGRVKLIVWDINDAEVMRRGESPTITIGDFSICSLGGNMVGTAVSTASDHLKVILWRVEENGEITRLRSMERDVVVTNTAISIIKYGTGANFFATVSQRLDSRLQVDVWDAHADGSLIHMASKSFVTPVKLPGATQVIPKLAMSNIGINSVACHYINETMQFTTFLWAYDQDAKKIVQTAMLANSPARILSSCSPARELSVAAIRVSNNKFKLIAFHFPDDAKSMEPGAHVDAGEITNIDVCPLGTEMVVTGHRKGEGANHLRLVLWQVKSGNFIKLTSVDADEEFSFLSMCQTGRNQFATAIRDSDGKLRVIAWRIPEIPSFDDTAPLPGFDLPSPSRRPVPKPNSKPTSRQPKRVQMEIDENCDTEDV